MRSSTPAERGNGIGAKRGRITNPGDVAELIEHGAKVVVLSRGHELRLGVTAEALEALEAAGIAVHVEETTKAVALYNQLVDTGKRVGALIHSTC